MRAVLLVWLAVGGWRLAGEAMAQDAPVAPVPPPTANRQPPTVQDSITVTATRTETRVADTPASVIVLSRETLARTAAPTLDDALRQVAGFTLFRRSGSRVANPTTQGVSLRGVGASG